MADRRATTKRRPLKRKRNAIRFMAGSILRPCKSFGEFDLRSPWISQVDDPQARCIRTVTNRAVGFDAGGLQFRDEGVDAFHFEADVIDGASLGRRLHSVDLSEREL